MDVTDRTFFAAGLKLSVFSHFVIQTFFEKCRFFEIFLFLFDFVT